MVINKIVRQELVPAQFNTEVILMLSLTAQAVVMAAPEPGQVTIDFTTINWFYYAIILAIVYLVMALKGNKAMWMALAIALVVAVAYALFVTYVVYKIT